MNSFEIIVREEACCCRGGRVYRGAVCAAAVGVFGQIEVVDDGGICLCWPGVEAVIRIRVLALHGVVAYPRQEAINKNSEFDV